MSEWDALDRELDAWRAAGRRATLWCRDDDAMRDTPQLQALLDIARARDIPVALAVIPAGLEAGLVHALRLVPQVTVVQHGYAHRNHAIAPARTCELGSHRPLATTLAELAIGREALVRAFGDRFAPIVVPPWNRIADDVVTALPGAGYRGLSAFGPRGAARPAPGLMQCNTHVDVIAWRRGRAFIGAERAVARTVEHLAARREGRVDPDEPTGILTHHLDLAAEAWAFLDELYARTRAHAAADWLSAGRVFGELST